VFAPTSFPEINALLALLLARVKDILKEELVAFYLEGSLALGDFDPATSDVDFIAGVARPLPVKTFEALVEMHRQITSSGRPFATELEGSYFPLPALRRHNPDDATYPNIERGLDEYLRLKVHHSDWVIHRYTAREHGISLFGPPPATLIDPVSAEDVRVATAGVLRSWWATEAAAEAIRRAHPGYLAYVVQTMCRALYALEYGQIVSKPAARRWALVTLDARWHDLIARSLRWANTHDMRDEVQVFVRHSIDRAYGY
jgi:hypothetical protein